jgi:hypothetical protein
MRGFGILETQQKTVAEADLIREDCDLTRFFLGSMRDPDYPLRPVPSIKTWMFIQRLSYSCFKRKNTHSVYFLCMSQFLRIQIDFLKMSLQLHSENAIIRPVVSAHQQASGSKQFLQNSKYVLKMFYVWSTGE